MIVEVVSVHAALAGRETITWRGDVSADELRLEHGVQPSHDVMLDEVNHALFRYFNRVDDADVGRLARAGYELPSLSVGDLITWGSKTYRVAGEGFDVITESSEYAMALVLYTMGARDPNAVVRRVLECARDVGLLYAIAKGDELEQVNVDAVVRELEQRTMGATS